MEMKSFYTVVVVEVDMWESSIVDERHFGSKLEAETFKRSLPKELNGLVCEVQI